MKRWAAAMYRFRWLVIGAWVAAFIGLEVVSGAVGSAYSDDFGLPDTDSTRAYSILQESFPTDSKASIQVVFKARTGTLADPANKTQVAKAVAAAADMPRVETVISPLDPRARGQVSEDGRIGYATVVFDEGDQTFNDFPAVAAVTDTVLARDSASLQVEAGGQLVQTSQQGEGSPSELIGFLAAALILAITFGTLVATCVPLVTAAISLSIGLALDSLISHGMNVAQFTPQLASLIGLGVGIDYALFLVSRFRNELHSGATVEEAVVTAVNTSGRAVTFAGITVCIALLGMVVLGVNFLVGVAVACSVAVAVTMLASVSFLPALLGVLGHKVDRIRLRPQRAAHDGPTRWERWAGLVRRRPVAAVVVGTIVVGALALPALGLRLGFSDTGTSQKTTTMRQAYDILGEGFGPGSNGPFLVTTSLDQPSDASALPALAKAIRETDGVAAVTPAQLDQAKNAAIMTVVPTGGPQDESTEQLLRTLRSDVVPTATEGTGLTTFIGGSTAFAVDFSEILGAKLPQFIGVVVLLSMLLLLIVFRSFVIPVKAAVMNLLSIAAAFGVVVLVFQQGWLSGLFGVAGDGPVEPFIPVILFAVLFGLSMDYEVFLVSRMHEEWVHTKDNATAVYRGLGSTAGVITAAAAIMISVFAAFILLPDRVIKIFGVGLASAIFIDAFIIRTLLVPGIMFLCGKWNWWIPEWLESRLPKVSIEGEYEDPDDVADPTEEPESLAGARG